jgi:hypothetical protein
MYKTTRIISKCKLLSSAEAVKFQQGERDMKQGVDEFTGASTTQPLGTRSANYYWNTYLECLPYLTGGSLTLCIIMQVVKLFPDETA